MFDPTYSLKSSKSTCFRLFQRGVTHLLSQKNEHLTQNVCSQDMLFFQHAVSKLLKALVFVLFSGELGTFFAKKTEHLTQNFCSQQMILPTCSLKASKSICFRHFQRGVRHLLRQKVELSTQFSFFSAMNLQPSFGKVEVEKCETKSF